MIRPALPGKKRRQVQLYCNSGNKSAQSNCADLAFDTGCQSRNLCKLHTGLFAPVPSSSATAKPRPCSPARGASMATAMLDARQENTKAPGIAPRGLAQGVGSDLPLVAVELFVTLLGFDAVLGGRADQQALQADRLAAIDRDQRLLPQLEMALDRITDATSAGSDGVSRLSMAVRLSSMRS